MLEETGDAAEPAGAVACRHGVRGRQGPHRRRVRQKQIGRHRQRLFRHHRALPACQAGRPAQASPGIRQQTHELGLQPPRRAGRRRKPRSRGPGRLRSRLPAERSLPGEPCTIAASATPRSAASTKRWPTSTAPSSSIPSTPTPISIGANCCTRQGKYDEAIGNYSVAMQMHEPDAGILSSRGHAFYRLKRYGEALRDYAKALELEPNNAAALVNRGDAYTDLGRYADAAADYRAAITADPQMGRAYQAAAWLMATCSDEHYRNDKLAVEAATKAIAARRRDGPQPGNAGRGPGQRRPVHRSQGHAGKSHRQGRARAARGRRETNGPLPARGRVPRNVAAAVGGHQGNAQTNRGREEKIPRAARQRRTCPTSRPASAIRKTPAKCPAPPWLRPSASHAASSGTLLASRCARRPAAGRPRPAAEAAAVALRCAEAAARSPAHASQNSYSSARPQLDCGLATP